MYTASIDNIHIDRSANREVQMTVFHVRVLPTFQRPALQTVTTHQCLFSCTCNYLVPSEILTCRLLKLLLDPPTVSFQSVIFFFAAQTLAI